MGALHKQRQRGRARVRGSLGAADSRCSTRAHSALSSFFFKHILFLASTTFSRSAAWRRDGTPRSGSTQFSTESACYLRALRRPRLRRPRRRRRAHLKASSCLRPTPCWSGSRISRSWPPKKLAGKDERVCPKLDSIPKSVRAAVASMRKGLGTGGDAASGSWSVRKLMGSTSDRA